MKKLSLTEFEHLLKKHDWSFQHAESADEYQSGRVERAVIRRAIARFAEEEKITAEALYRQYGGQYA